MLRRTPGGQVPMDLRLWYNSGEEAAPPARGGGERRGGMARLQKLRRLGGALCALALVLTLAVPAGQAALSGVYFTVINDDPMELSQATMPFWSGGRLYVSNAIFDGTYGDSLGITCSYSTTKQTAVIYTIRVALFFELSGAGAAYDNQGRIYSERAIVRGSYVFFPVDLIADVFELTFTYLRVDPAPVIRLKSSSARLTDEVFLDAAEGLLRERYRSYEASLAPAPSSEPDEPDVPPTVYGGQRVYLIFRVTDPESARRLLATLNASGKQGTFLFDEEGLAGDADLVRAAAGGGHAVGFLVTGRDAEAQLERCAALLWDAARIPTRLVWLEEDQGGLAAELAAAGYCVMGSRLDYSGAPLTTVSRAATLYARITGLNLSDLPVYLGADRENTGGLARLLTSLDSSDCRVIAYRETL